MSASTTRPQRSVREEIDRIVILTRRALTFWKRALLTFVVVAAVAVPMALSAPRLYRSETVVLYQEAFRNSEIGTGNEGSTENARRVGARLREVLLSRASLEPIVK